MERKYTEEELVLISEISKKEAYISKEEVVEIALKAAKMIQPYPTCEVDFDYQKTKDNSLEAQYQVCFTLNCRMYCYIIQATTGKILSSTITPIYKGSFFKDGVTYLKYADETNFTSDLGMKIRSQTYEPLKKPLLKATDGTVYLEEITRYGEETIVNLRQDLSFLELSSHQPYIFVSTHSFCEDVNAAFAIMDRNAYLLFGSTDQLENAKEVYGLWAMGTVYVARLDPWSRANSLLKLERLIKNGTSVIICAEGGYNNTENKVVEEMFEGAVQLNRKTYAPIVPLASFREHGEENIYITADAPRQYLNVTATEGTERLRNSLATLEYELWIHHASRLRRETLPLDCRFQFMEERKSEYLKSHWTHDVWEEELTKRKNSRRPRPEEVREGFERVKLTRENYLAVHSIRKLRCEDLIYDFKRYMHNTWNLSYEETYERYIRPYVNQEDEVQLERVLLKNE